MFNKVEETGKPIREFSTGSVRDNAEGKGRFDLIPTYSLKRLAMHYENGAKKYGDRNWELGQPLHSYLDSAMRHLARFMDGEDQEDHLSAVAWNCFAFMDTEKRVIDEELPLELVAQLKPIIRDKIINQAFTVAKRKVASDYLDSVANEGELKITLDTNEEE